HRFFSERRLTGGRTAAGFAERGTFRTHFRGERGKSPEGFTATPGGRKPPPSPQPRRAACRTENDPHGQKTTTPGTRPVRAGATGLPRSSLNLPRTTWQHVTPSR